MQPVASREMAPTWDAARAGNLVNDAALFLKSDSMASMTPYVPLRLPAWLR